MQVDVRHVLVLAFALLGMLMPDSAAAQQRTLCVHGIADGQSLPVRSGPGAAHPVIGAFPARSCDIRLVGRCENPWCELAHGNVAGWVDTRSIGVYETPAQQEAPSAMRAAPRVVEQGSSDGRSCVARVERGDTLRIRNGPGIDFDEIGEIPPRACGVGIVGGCKGRWCRIAWRGRTGWVNTYYLD